MKNPRFTFEVGSHLFVYRLIAISLAVWILKIHIIDNYVKFLHNKLNIIILEDGNYMKIGIKQISELTGFSISTISNVLNNKKGVSAKTAHKVLRAAKEIGYILPSKINQIKLVMYQKSGKVLIETPLISALLDGVENEVRKKGYDTIICTIKENDPNFEKRLNSILKDQNFGIILLATEMNVEDIRKFCSISAPLVVVDAWFGSENFDTVLMNNTDSVMNAVEYLIQNGHREIGCLRSNITIQNFHHRRLGLSLVMEKYGLKLSEKYCVDLEPTVNGAYEDMKKFLVNTPQLPTAYYSDNDIIAIGAMKAFKERGIKIPDDVSIIGFDNMPFSEITSPPLTTIDVPKREIGIMAARKLIDQINNEYIGPTCTELLTKLLIRGTVRKV